MHESNNSDHNDDKLTAPVSRPMNRRASSRRAGLPALATRQVSDGVISYANVSLGSSTGTGTGTGTPTRPTAVMRRSPNYETSSSTAINYTSTSNASSSIGSPTQRGFPKGWIDNHQESTPAFPTQSDADSSEGRSSWYMEALQQGGSAADLDHFLGNTRGPSDANIDNSNFGAFDDNEVLEQYRIMAQHEAYIRVKENTGFDVADYEKRKKLQGSEMSEKRRLYGGTKSKLRLPDPHKFVSASGTPKPEEPPLPTSKALSRCKFLEQMNAKVPDLCPGIAVRGGAVVPKDEHVVRCLGCRGQVRVKLLATLVSCPECNTVSPASSTRR